eukprot:TRINITY_DN7276_c0_g1_i1.p1 TRINITY_DN7276_c0_g1~~TRINITY_DN7276_c0_g1_i1.p1  ORF type:complete len:345 (+),score=53.59 TRINITY_DN7276_c0_g1_i1:196-1230(+)
MFSTSGTVLLSLVLHVVVSNGLLIDDAHVDRVGIRREGGPQVIESRAGGKILSITTEDVDIATSLPQQLQWLDDNLSGMKKSTPKVVILPRDPLVSKYLSQNLLPILVRHRVPTIVSGEESNGRHTHTIKSFGVHNINCYHFSQHGNETNPVAADLSVVGEEVVQFTFTEPELCPIFIGLFPEAAPMTVKSFLHLVQSGFYDQSTFYRAEKRFVLQGGARRVNGKMPDKKVAPLPLEAGLPNQRGTLAMARTPNPNSATTEYFINVGTNTGLDVGSKGPGYAVFGTLLGQHSMPVVQSILKRPTKKQGKLNILINYVEIAKATILTYEEAMRRSQIDCALVGKK